MFGQLAAGSGKVNKLKLKILNFSGEFAWSCVATANLHWHSPEVADVLKAQTSRYPDVESETSGKTTAHLWGFNNWHSAEIMIILDVVNDRKWKAPLLSDVTSKHKHSSCGCVSWYMIPLHCERRATCLLGLVYLCVSHRGVEQSSK